MQAIAAGEDGKKRRGEGKEEEGGRICEKKKRRRDDMKHEDGLGMNVMREKKTKAKNGKECDTLTDVASSYQRK